MAQSASRPEYLRRSVALASITPSGNRVVEGLTQAICRDFPDISTHFTRIPVHGDTGGITGYDWDRMLDAATLLSHVEPDVICWNGSKGGTLGFDIDTTLCEKMTAATGVKSTTAALSILDALEALDAHHIALVTPYDAAYQAKCVAGFASKGIICASERHSGLLDNLSYASVPASDIAAMTRAAILETPVDAVVYFCTNFPGAPLAAELEAEMGVPILDSTALGIWGALKAAGFETNRIKGWGRVFSL